MKEKRYKYLGTGSPYYVKGNIYREDSKIANSRYTIKECVTEMPNKWELIEDPKEKLEYVTYKKEGEVRAVYLRVANQTSKTSFKYKYRFYLTVYKKNQAVSRSEVILHVQPSTPEEIAWLDACIKEDKYVPKPTVSSEEKYYKYIYSGGSAHFTKGQIYSESFSPNKASTVRKCVKLSPYKWELLTKEPISSKLKTSKVDRDIIIKVESEEEYAKLVKTLKEKGEKVSKIYTYYNDWQYGVYNKNMGQWELISNINYKNNKKTLSLFSLTQFLGAELVPPKILTEYYPIIKVHSRKEYYKVLDYFEDSGDKVFRNLSFIEKSWEHVYFNPAAKKWQLEQVSTFKNLPYKYDIIEFKDFFSSHASTVKKGEKLLSFLDYPCIDNFKTPTETTLIVIQKNTTITMNKISLDTEDLIVPKPTLIKFTEI